MSVLSLTLNNDELADLYHLVKETKRDISDSHHDWCSNVMRMMSDHYKSRDTHIVVFKDVSLMFLRESVKYYINNYSGYEKYDMAMSIYRSIRSQERTEEKAAERGWDTGQEVWDTGIRTDDGADHPF